MFQKTLETLFRRLGKQAVLITAEDPEINIVVVPTPEEFPDIHPEARHRSGFLRFDVLQSDYSSPTLDDVLKIGGSFYQIAAFSSPDAENLIWTLEVERYHGETQF